MRPWVVRYSVVATVIPESCIVCRVSFFRQSCRSGCLDEPYYNRIQMTMSVLAAHPPSRPACRLGLAKSSVHLDRHGDYSLHYSAAPGR
jgi:hypothetical protein